MTARLRILAGVLLTVVVSGGALALARSDTKDRFDHQQHAALFPTCTSCHLGAVEAGAPPWPTRAGCEACHDGKTQRYVDWEPEAADEGGNLRFTHAGHAQQVMSANAADSVLAGQCATCHNLAGTPRMAVQHAVVGNCLDCHKVAGEHLAVADTACATCHMPLGESPGLSREDIAAFPVPPSHRAADFAQEGHGRVAGVPGQPGMVAQSCATCHAKNFCVTCHVNAPEVPVIQALAPDERSTAIAVILPIPASHRESSFERTHGPASKRSSATCATCHTKESCQTCHQGLPPARSQQLASAGPGRGPGAQLQRAAPASHTFEFRDRHGAEASSRPASCQACHAQQTCFSCHVPNGGSSESYHPAGFLTRHPSAAYNRDASCSDCHNPAQFCQSCHQQSGLVSGIRGLGSKNLHDAMPNFIVGHGQAARLNLESCASCHVERDCTRCHAAQPLGFGFNPHGPNWKPQTVGKKNPQLCIACHGSVPGR